MFVRDPLEVVDAVVVIASLIVVIVDLSIDTESAKYLKYVLLHLSYQIYKSMATDSHLEGYLLSPLFGQLLYEFTL